MNLSKNGDKPVTGIYNLTVTGLDTTPDKECTAEEQDDRIQ